MYFQDALKKIIFAKKKALTFIRALSKV